MKINREKELYSKPAIKIIEVFCENNILIDSGIPGEDDEVDDQGEF